MEKEQKEVLEVPREKSSNKNTITIIVALILLAILIFIGFLIYLYFQSTEKQLSLGANIEKALISDESKTVYLKLAGGINYGNITKIKFVFRDAEGNEYSYETNEGAQEISVPFKRSFSDWLLGKQKYEGKYDYEIKAEDIELKNFNNIEEVSVFFEYKTETEQEKETPILDTEKLTAQNKTISSGGGDRGSSGNGGTATCTPGSWTDTTEYRCSSVEIREKKQTRTACPSGIEEQWLEDACPEDYICQNGQCIELINCTHNNNCIYLNNTCGYGICNLTTKTCQLMFNSSTTICREAVGECDITDYCSESSVVCTDTFNSSGILCSLGICDGNGNCVKEGICGNNITETGEICDGTDLGEETCQSQGYNEGNLFCCFNCSGFDFSQCINIMRTCTDYDGGTNFSVASNVSKLETIQAGPDCFGITPVGGAYWSVTLDSCNGNILAERICNADNTNGTIEHDCNSEGKTCQDGACVACTPNCAGKECGNNGCGGSCPPGCNAGYYCQEGRCVESITKIKLEPSTTVEVGEEVYFDGSYYLDESTDRGSFEWDFGDGAGVKRGYPHSTSREGGPVVTHSFKRSGTYAVSLNVTNEAGNSNCDTLNITVTASPNLPIIQPRTSKAPLLEMKFENNLQISGSETSNLNAVWENGGRYVNGVDEGKAADLTNGAYIRIPDPNGILSNMQQLTISFWAKKSTTDNYGCFIEKASSSVYPAYRMYISTPRIYGASVYTSSIASAKKDPLYDVQNTAWHHYIMAYDGTNIKIYLDGVEVANKTHTGNIVLSNYDLIIGRRANGADIFNGYIDELKIYNKALTPDEIAKKFELLHGDFHGRIAQYIDAQIPVPVTENSANKLKVTITGNGYSETLINKNALVLKERFLLNNSKLPAGNYTLIAQILDARNNVLEEIKEKFEKSYDGISKVGIDENNAIKINGNLFFPVTPWGQRTANFNSWANNYTNSLYLEAFWSDAYGTDVPSLLTWQDYLNQANNYGLKVIGPGRWEGLIRVYPYMKNSNPNKIVEYIKATKNHNAILGWMWGDEPDLYGVPSPVVRAWTYKSHKLDPQHLVVTNFAGKNTWVEGDASAHNSIRGSWEYPYNEKWFGKKTNVVDVAGFDYYPLDWRLRYASSMDKLTIGLDRIVGENPYIPVMSFVETANIKDDVGSDGNGGRFFSVGRYSITSAPESVITRIPFWFQNYTFYEGAQLKIIATGSNGHAVPGVYTIKEKPDNHTLILTTDATDGFGDDVDVTIEVVGTLPPTPEQLKMLTWLTVVHGVKGINWFPFFTQTPPENYAVMAEFLKHITELTPVVLAPDTNRRVTDNANTVGNRVDTMIKEHQGDIYVFAVRLTEVTEPQSGEITVTFSVSGLNNAIAEVFNESRTIQINNGQFTDVFAPNAVHIYKISVSEVGSLSPFSRIWNWLKSLFTK